MFGLAGIKLYIFLGLVLALVLMTSANAVLWANLGKKGAEITSLTDQLSVAKGDVARLEADAITSRGIITRQSNQLRQLESDGAAARTIAAMNMDVAQAKIAALETRNANLMEAARARPQDVRPLGPIVLDALRSLRK
jgi:TolA-binding protein